MTVYISIFREGNTWYATADGSGEVVATGPGLQSLAAEIQSLANRTGHVYYAAEYAREWCAC